VNPRHPTRREFTQGLGLALAGAGSAGPALAQAFPAEGTHYARLAEPVPVAASGKVEVVEFFWYGCPHCAALEPQLEAWVAKLPADVAFRRAPVSFGPMHEYHAKLYFAIETLGLMATLHRKVFTAIHGEHKRLDKDADVAAFANALGADGAKLVETLKSFSVVGKARQAKQLAMAYKIEGVPTLGVQGRYYTSASQAGGGDAVFRATDHLIGLARKTLR
jgi:thiol:disulfide interchange protein DsbA